MSRRASVVEAFSERFRDVKLVEEDPYPVHAGERRSVRVLGITIGTAENTDMAGKWAIMCYDFAPNAVGAALLPDFVTNATESSPCLFINFESGAFSILLDNGDDVELSVNIGALARFPTQITSKTTH